MKQKPFFELEVIIVRQSLFESVMSDIFTFVTLAGLVGLGWWIDSAAMQWVGGMMFLFFMCSRMTRVAQDSRMTIAQARKKLDELEATA